MASWIRHPRARATPSLAKSPVLELALDGFFTRTRGVLLIGSGAAVAGLTALAFWKRKELGAMGLKAVSAGKEIAFAAVLPSGVSSYATEILNSAREYSVSPWLLAGIMLRESAGGLAPGYTPKGPRGTGDWTPRSPTGRYAPYMDPATGLPKDGLGWGRGLMQLDFGAHNAWVTSHDWGDAQTNVEKGASVLADALKFFQRPASGANDPRPLKDARLVEAALAAYNTGAGNVLASLKAGKAASAMTTGGDYSNWVLSRAASWAARFA